MMFTEIGRFLVAVDARRVHRIHDTMAPASEATDSIDLAAKLGEGAAFPGAWPRRVIELTTSRGPVAVLAGEEVWPAMIESESLQAVPGLLSHDLQRAGIAQVLLGEEDRFAYVLDPEALYERDL
jgi:hypothetical protein